MKRARQKSDENTRKRARNVVAIYWLPPEIWEHVISFLHPKKDRWRVSHVCKAWNELVWDAFDPSDEDYWAIEAASGWHGRAETLKRFLLDKRVDLDRGCYLAMWNAVDHHYLQNSVPIMKLCLELGGGDPFTIRNRLLACAIGSLDMVRLLLADKRVNPAADQNWALTVACMHENTACDLHSEDSLKVVRLLLDDPRVNPVDHNCKAIRVASENGNADTLMMLLADDRVRADLSVDTDRALLLACKNGHLEVVRVLLENGRANPAVICGPATCLAQKNGHTDVAELLDAHVLGELD